MRRGIIAETLRLGRPGATRWFGNFNLTCEYCSRSSAPWDHVDLSLATIEHLLTDATAVAPSKLSVAITGGEPILHPEFAAILDIVKGFPVTVSLNSNGLMLDEEVVSSCFEHGLKSFSVSIDGAEATYRRVEGHTSSIDAICANLRRIVNGGGHVFVSCTLTRDNVDDIEESYSSRNPWARTG